MPGWILRRSSSKNAGGIPGNTMRFYFEWTDLRPAEDVSPLIIHEPHNQGIDIQSLAERGTQFPRLAGNSWGTGLAVAALQI